MKRLPERVKRRIIEHLACYHSPKEVADLIEEEFDVHLTSRHVRAYDPTSFQFAAAPCWIEYFSATRRRFEQEIGEVPIAHRAYRLRRLGKLFEQAKEEGRYHDAIACLEQAAKEVGNWFIRR